jgi:hypothetical protein
MIERFLTEIVSSLDVDFSRQVIKQNQFGYPLFDFYWDKSQFNGIYREYEQFNNYGQSVQNNQKTWLKVIGEYQNGKKNGVWRYFTIRRTVSTRIFQEYVYSDQPVLDYEIEYVLDKPIRLKEYFEDVVKTTEGLEVKYATIFTLDVPDKNLNVDVYQNQKLVRSYNSSQDYIDYWDIYDTHRRILNNLNNPNLDMPIKRDFTIKDKPEVSRNKSTNNYILYDELKRRSKDHALLIATDDYKNYGYEKLKNPIRDAEAIGKNLKNIYGFECETVKNPTKQQFLKVLEKYRNIKFDSTEQLLIYITGHGMYDDKLKDGYIIPTDGETAYSDVSHSSWISYTELSLAISKLQSKHVLLMIDACYSGALENAVAKLKSASDTFGRKMADPKIWFMNKIRFKTKMFITSSAADRMSSDGINNSPFASMFIRALQSIKERDSYILDVSDVWAMLNKIIPSPRMEYFPGHERESSFFFVMQ